VLALGLFLGNQIGVSGVSLLCGVGFTMSLFIGVLAFPGTSDSPEQVAVKLGVLGGSVLSAIFGAVVLAVATRRRQIRAAAGTGAHTGQANTDPA
jgi:NhaA family Na+:H+ antiporter